MDPYLEELIVRRELPMNFVHYEKDYDKFPCLPSWARETLEDHKDDPREHVYAAERLEAAETHDEYWNAAMKEMVHTGCMHNYMRMYWGKKILEWSNTPEHACERIGAESEAERVRREGGGEGRRFGLIKPSSFSGRRRARSACGFFCGFFCAITTSPAYQD